MPSKVRSVLVIAAVSLFGLGCAKAAPVKKTVTQAQRPVASSTVPFPTFPHIDQTLTPKEKLDQILQNFNSTKSFRATVKTNVHGLSVVGAMEFAKPDRFYGLIESASSTNDQAEIIVVQNDLYVRTANTNWVNVTKTKGSQTIAVALQNTLSGQDSLEQLDLKNAASITEAQDPVRDCDLYSVHVTDADGDREVDICTVDDLPKYMDITKSDGTTSMMFFDYNDVFTIMRPAT